MVELKVYDVIFGDKISELVTETLLNLYVHLFLFGVVEELL